MALKAKYPIRLKLLLLMSTIVVAASAAYFLLAVRILNEDKAQLVYELNASNVKTLAAEADSLLLRFADKTKLLAQGNRIADWSQEIFESDKELIAFTLFRPGKEAPGWDVESRVRSAEYLKLYGLPVESVEKIREQVPVPFEKILQSGMLAWNSTIKGGAPVMTLALSLQFKGQDDPRVAVIDLRLDGLLRLLADRGIATVYLVDYEGRIVAHPDSEKTATRQQLADVEIVRDAVHSKIAFEMKKFYWMGTRWIGAYAAVGRAGLHVISQIEEKQAFRAASRLIVKTALFGALVVTLALLVSGWLAGTFTKPLALLSQATDKLSQWDFSEPVKATTNDEIGRLAAAFNSMAGDIQRQHAQIKTHEAELEDKVRERTIELEKEKQRVSETQEALVRTTRLASLGELAGAAAHEVLNPLNNMGIRLERARERIEKNELPDVSLLGDIVSGWKKAYFEGGWESLSKDLVRTNDDGRAMIEEDLSNLQSIIGDQGGRIEAQKEDIEFLRREIARITKLINNMRALSRVGGERRPVDLRLPVDDTVAAVSDLLAKKEIRLVTEHAAGPLEVVADKDELMQVFSNLIRNAMQAVESAGRRSGEIRITTSKQDNRVLIRISDNGSGIVVTNLPRIFEPSFTTKTLEKGTGLGLSISRRLVRAFGGDIEVEKTEEGQGTTFMIWLPAREEVNGN